MVQLVKRQKTDKTAKYSDAFIFSSLTFKQAPQALSISKQNILISVPSEPIPSQVNWITGNLYNYALIQKRRIELIENFHKQYAITHLQWNKKGNTFASIDETGQLALWQIQGPVDKLLYNTHLKQPLAAFHWLDAEREYISDGDKLVREFKNCLKNPFGYLGFITITVHGEITVHYQRNGAIFSSFSAHIPSTGRRDIRRSDASCYSMSLSGIDDWQRISHAAITSIDNTIYLATHSVSCQTKEIQLYSLDIKFPTVDKKGAIRRKQVANVCLLEKAHVTQMVFKTGANLELYLGLGEKSDQTLKSYIQHWELSTVDQSLNLSIGTISAKHATLSLTSEIPIDAKFITCLKCTQDGNLVVGLSDGSIHLEISNHGLLKSNETPSFDSRFWCVVQPKKDTISDIVFSVNETHIVYMYASGKIGVARITNDALNEQQVKHLRLKLVQCLLNNTDSTDLISEVSRISKVSKTDIPLEIMQDVLKMYEQHHEGDEEWNLGALQKGYGLALATFNEFPAKHVQSTNLSRAVQLPIILDSFIASCTSKYEDIEKALSKETSIHLEFDPNSLWSLVILTTWIFDFLKWILHEWNILLHSEKHPISEEMMYQKPVHAVLFLHKESRDYLKKILTFIPHFITFASSATYQLDHLPESQSLLQQYTDNLQKGPPVAISQVVDLLNDLSHLEANTKVSNRWSLLLTSTLQGYSIPKLQQMSLKYKDKCVKPCIYIEKEILAAYDPIRKRSLGDHVKTHLCIRCHQHILPVHTESDLLDPTSSASWYQSLGRRCVCGGVFV
ncbi:hypothetical protein RMATCC62417_06775 [Rhizopus microsporus]|nr:hypothetical protein RMATCC62417_06775 [Rhizopus microsporus]